MANRRVQSQAQTQPAVKTKEEAPVTPNIQESGSSFFDFFRFGESYTSLILGIIVVIVATVLLLSFVHSKNVSTSTQPNKQTASQQAPKKIAQVSQSITPTQTPTPTKTAPTKAQPTAKPTKVVTKAPTPTRAKKVVAVKTNNTARGTQQGKGTVYTVAAGDNLWKIAEVHYKSGYNWVDIARANNLNDPNTIHKGDKLTLPKVEPKIATIVTPAPQKVANSAPTKLQSKSGVNLNKISGSKYTVTKGDNLWNIAVRAYGDGYQWVKLAQANNLSNPSVIHSGNVLTIPRG